MTLLEYQWRDFVVFPLDPNRIRRREERFDLALENEGASVVRKDLVVWSGDEFEAMRVDEAGNVEVWTKKRVWCLRRAHDMEKLRFFFRHPYENPEYA